MLKIWLFSILLTIIILCGCEKDPTSVDKKKTVKLSGAFIINEGNFNQSNGSLSFYSMEDHQVQHGIFESVNGRNLGDVVQSMTIIDTLGFIVINNSSKVEVISKITWKSIVTIDLPAGSSPRYFVDGGNGKGYVTNLYTNSVSIINLSTYAVEQSINVGVNPEELVIVNGKAYVANSGFGTGKTVSVINLTSNQVVKTIRVGDNPGAIEIDPGNNIHVLCTGQWGDWNDPNDTGTDGGVFIIDSNTDTVIDSLVIAGHPSKLCLNNNNTGYFLNGDQVVSYSTETNEVVNDTLISGFYYGLEFDPISEQIFVLDAIDYSQNGELKIFSPAGQLKESHTVGIIPGSVTFIYE